MAIAATLHGSSFATATATTIAHSTTGAAGAGSIMVALVSWTHASATVSLSGGGLTWTQRGSTIRVGSRAAAIFTASAPSGLAAATSITATFSATSTNRCLGIMSSTGLADPVVLHTSNTRSGTTAAWDGGNLVTTTPNTLLVGMSNWADDAVSATPAAPGVEVLDRAMSSGGAHGVYEIASTSATHTVGGTYTEAPGGGGWAATSICLEEPGAAVGTVVARRRPHSGLNMRARRRR